MNNHYNNKALTEKRRELRKKQTETERIVWFHLRDRRMHGKKFYRQYSVGFYILDFYCPEMRLAIEIDGSQHYEEENKKHDQNRTAYLSERDIHVMRFTNLDILQNLYLVRNVIYKYIETKESTF